MNINAIALSALNAFEKKLAVTANNIANMNTEDFKPSEAAMHDNANQGVYVTLSQSPTAEVDLAKEMVSLMMAKQGIEANLKTIKTGDEINKSLLDIIV